MFGGNYVIASTIDLFINIIYFLIFIRIIISWLPIPKDNQYIKLLYTLTEPILGPVRTLLDKSIFGGKQMMVDFSPMIALLLLSLIRGILVG